jgi:hypothetical protein
LYLQQLGKSFLKLFFTKQKGLQFHDFRPLFQQKGLISASVLPIIQAAIGAASRTTPAPSEAMPKQA